MNKQEKAKIILEQLDEYIQVNWNLEEFYLKAIMNGLNEIEERENNERKNTENIQA